MFNTISEIKNANAAHGQKFFSPGAMRFFGCRVLPVVYGGRYFVTSEQYPGCPRLYSVCRASDTGQVDTMFDCPGGPGGFQAFGNASSAKRAAIFCAAHDQELAAVGAILTGIWWLKA